MNHCTLDNGTLSAPSRQRRELQRGTLGALDHLYGLEHIQRELLLQLLVRIVDAQLLEPVHAEALEPKDVKKGNRSAGAQRFPSTPSMMRRRDRRQGRMRWRGRASVDALHQPIKQPAQTRCEPICSRRPGQGIGGAIESILTAESSQAPCERLREIAMEV